MARSTSSNDEDDCLAIDMGLTTEIESSVGIPQDDGDRDDDGGDVNDCRLSFLLTRDSDEDRYRYDNDYCNKNTTAVFDAKSEQDQKRNINCIPIARTILLLREYEEKFGMPSEVSATNQAFILREINKYLYAGGVPVWVLADVMVKAAEGLMGKTGIHFWLLPRKTLIIDPSHSSSKTSMYSTVRGFAMFKLNRMAPVAIRLASFASRSKFDPMNFPHPEVLRKASASASTRNCESQQHDRTLEREELAAKILNSASNTRGWFSFVNREDVTPDTDREHDPVDAVWDVAATTRELFYRLVAIEALASIKTIQSTPDVSYPFAVLALFEMVSSAGACAFWFNGSWQDMVGSAIISFFVAVIKFSSLRLPGRIALEVIASFVVGLFAGLIALKWPEHTCFGAMSLSGVLGILHGFKIVFAIMEIMSRHTVTGGADLLEGILFTGLIAYFLQSGQYVAVLIMGDPDALVDNLSCDHSINDWWYLLLVPLAAMSWSGLFHPSTLSELLLMGFHGTLGFTVSWAISRASFNPGNLHNFAASVAVTFSAGMIARWTGRQALGNIVAGIFGLVPGAYLVRKMYADDYNGFIGSTVVRCIIIGVGASAGIHLSSPTFLGKKSALCAHASKRKKPQERTREGSDSILFF